MTIRKIRTKLINGKIIKGYEVSAGGLRYKTITKKDALKFQKQMRRKK